MAAHPPDQALTTLFSHYRYGLKKGKIRCPRTLVVKAMKCPACWTPVVFVYVQGEQTRATCVTAESWAREGGSPYFIKGKHDVHKCAKFFARLKLYRIHSEGDFTVEMPSFDTSPDAPTG